METNFVVYAILVVAVLLLVNRVIKLRRINEELANEIELDKQILKGERESVDKINSLRVKLMNENRLLTAKNRDLTVYSDKKYHTNIELEKENNRLLNQLNELKGAYSKELKEVELLATNRLSEINNRVTEKNKLLFELNRLQSENEVLLAKCDFLEACNNREVQTKSKKPPTPVFQQHYHKNELKKKVLAKLKTLNTATTNGDLCKEVNAHYYSVRKSLKSLLKDKAIKSKRSGRVVFYWAEGIKK